MGLYQSEKDNVYKGILSADKNVSNNGVVASVTLPAGHYLVMARTSQQAWYGENNSAVTDTTSSKYWVTGSDGVPGTSVMGGKKNQTEQLSLWFPGFSGIKYLIFEQNTTISLFNLTGSAKTYLKGDGIVTLKLA